ncbi:SDR family NAD(P)-dependent oxidoreductase [Niallia circulans]|uniref:SDR family NAD(P)-dependent oxidoreductase n=1 Tax=Niallia circulans TaxID=1397 RepID=A0A553SU29_NIACI|nr:SDR family NAD(P)-dependent oxidoreductase [Niallia circulans]TRZ40499.1 SDR family NAD(P)-dependent oxidoreductase [Niallia circulans]
MRNREKVWFITGASRGMGIEFTKAALAQGNKVVATGRNTDKISKIMEENENLLVVKLDVTSPSDAKAAVKAAVDKFGKIDVLINNAANFLGGYFEELTPEQIDSQLRTNLIGPMNVTREVLPVMRNNRSGHIITISSGAGLSGFEFNTAYAASKFGLEGWMESLQPEVSPFGIYTTIINPGMFRTEFLTKESSTYAKPSIEDYSGRRERNQDSFNAQNGRQAGDAAKLAEMLIKISNEESPPSRFIAGTDAVCIAEQKVTNLEKEINAYRKISVSLAHEDV